MSSSLGRRCACERPLDADLAPANDRHAKRGVNVQAQKASRTSKFVRRLLQPSNLLLVALWGFFLFLVYYVQVRAAPLPPRSNIQHNASA